eukprot:gnl/Trimastix_PCT/3622.p1 GENE.gnl/Trimastix_PCT/3622~~gnl/Trimastix_PCT/3622.p1  ORF type:complete len:449 (+),score=124.14 gnl/Trimastix_PCT/3622:55-1401(+)
MSASKNKNLIPITRAFLCDFYATFPEQLIPPEIEECQREIRATLAALNNTQLTEKLTIPIPHHMDETMLRNSEQCEQCLALLQTAHLERLQGIADADPSWIQQQAEAIRGHLDRATESNNGYRQVTVDTVMELIKRFLPDGIRLRLFLRQQQKGEIKKQQEQARLIAQGMPIRQRYDLLWKQQMDRRRQLISIGSARGVFRFVLRFLAGVPKTLLDFVKQINDPEGPFEELRSRYGPCLYALLRFVNEIHLLLASLMAAPSLPFRTDTPGALSVEGVLSLCVRASELYAERSVAFYAFMADLNRRSPYFITAEEAAACSSAPEPATLTPVTLAARSVHDEAVECTPGATLGWEFTLRAKDIIFSIDRIAPEDTPVSIVPPTTYSTRAEPHQGEIAIEVGGTYRCRWSNQHSRFTKKQLELRVDMAPALDEASPATDAAPAEPPTAAAE